MRFETIITIFEWLFLLYLLGLTAGYLMLDLVAAVHLRSYMEERALANLPHGYSGFEPQISLLVPAYNEEANIGQLLEDISRQAEYGFTIDSIIVASDGSTDRTVEITRNSGRKTVVFDNPVREGVAVRQKSDSQSPVA